MTATKDDFYHVGLTDDEVRKSRTEHGVNLLTPPKRPSLWKLYLEKFEDPVVRVLLVAAFFSLIISIVENEYAETIGIIAAILLATEKPIFPMRLASFVSWIFNGVGSVVCSVLWRATFPISVASPTNSTRITPCPSTTVVPRITRLEA